jgi:hypothetical protein
MPEEPEDERACSTLRWDDVSLPPSVSEADSDALIFPELAQNWRKVARVVAYVRQACEARSLPISVHEIAARVRALVEAETIEGVGNLSTWRHSEVRLKDR